MCQVARRFAVIAVLTLLAAAGARAGQAVTAQQAQRDAAQLVKDLKTLRDAVRDFNRSKGAGKGAGKGQGEDPHAAVLQRLAALEKQIIAPIQARYDAYTRNYGNSRSAIDKKFKQILGRRLRQRPSWAWEELGPQLAKARSLRSDAAATLVRGAKITLGHMRSLSRNIWAKSFQSSKRELQAALRYDPDNQEAKSLLATIDQKKAKALADLEAEIDKAEWKPHSAHFNGPGDPDALARIVFEQLRTDDKGNKSDSVLAVRIRGDWRVWDEVLGIPKNYGLPVEVAYKVKNEPQNAVVQRLTMVTRENRKAPPFRYRPGVGDSYKVRRSKVTPMGAGSASPFILFRLILAAGLFLSGLVAAASLLQSLNPAMGATLDRIAPLKAVIGVAVLLMGGLFFVKNLLWLSPLADILPQAAAVLVGLLLGLELLLKVKAPPAAPAAQAPAPEPASADAAAAGEAPETEPAPGSEQPDAVAAQAKEAGAAAAQKLQGALAGQEERIKSLRKYQARIGIACIVLGLLHLLLAGWWLL